MTYRQLRSLIHSDEQLGELRKLHRALRHGDRDDRHKVWQAMRNREEELFQQYITPKTPADWNKVNEGIKGYGRWPSDVVKNNERIAVCECGSNSHAHSINCPQHPGNLQPPVGWK